MDALVTPSILLPAQRDLECGGRVAAARDETQIGAGVSLTEQTGGVGPPNRWAVLALVALGTFMTTLDSQLITRAE